MDTPLGGDRSAVVVRPHAGAAESPALYARLAPVYDVIYRAALQNGRNRAIERLCLRDGEDVLEVGVGTALSALQYPTRCRVVAIDRSRFMLRRAQRRLERRCIRHVRLCEMDGTRLGFDDARFDAVYAPYFVNTVSDPIAVAREMLRVCRRGGRLVFLNHFHSRGDERRTVDRMVGRLATRFCGVDWTLNLAAFLQQLDLKAESIERVNPARVSSLVVCRKP